MAFAFKADRRRCIGVADREEHSIVSFTFRYNKHSRLMAYVYRLMQAFIDLCGEKEARWKGFAKVHLDGDLMVFRFGYIG